MTISGPATPASENRRSACRLLAQGLRDLHAIGDFIALDSPNRAATFVAELEAACESLASESTRYPLLEGIDGYRRMPIGNYLVLYQVTSAAVRIVRVVHAARDLRDLV